MLAEEDSTHSTNARNEYGKKKIRLALNDNAGFDEAFLNKLIFYTKGG